MTTEQKPPYEWCDKCGERLHPTHEVCDVCNEHIVVIQDGDL